MAGNFTAGQVLCKIMPKCQKFREVSLSIFCCVWGSWEGPMVILPSFTLELLPVQQSAEAKLRISEQCVHFIHLSLARFTESATFIHTEREKRQPFHVYNYSFNWSITNLECYGWDLFPIDSVYLRFIKTANIF